MGGEYDFCAVLAPTTAQALSQNLDADVIIARGALAFDLKRRGGPIPIVELVISGEDILNVLYKLKELYGAAPAGIIGSTNMILRDRGNRPAYRRGCNALLSGRKYRRGGIPSGCACG